MKEFEMATKELQTAVEDDQKMKVEIASTEKISHCSKK